MADLDRQHELRRAFDNEEFSLHYQPVVRLGDRAIVGFEALVRWLHPDGIILPEVFLPQVEAAGLMPQLGQRVIENAAAALRRLELAMPLRPGLAAGDLFMSVNLSAAQLDDPHLLDTIEGALAANRLEPGRLRLEISEALVSTRIDEVARLVGPCAELGVGIAIDQFGTGPSALSALSRLPVGGVKLARCFALDLARHPRGAEVLRAVAKFARQLKMACVAFCIEDYQQAAIARDLGVEFGQGHFFGTAMPLMVASSFVRRSVERSFEEAGGTELAVPPVSA
jgi:EAL domain-containing protein (putative c-di-GMP-specific phosphodiesterase class I)